MPRRQLATARPQEKTQREVEDLRLVLRARNGDSAAMDALLRRYTGFVRLKASSYFIAGGEADDLIQEGLVGLLTAVATGLGAVPVFLLGDRVEALRPFLWGLTIGLMGVAAVVGLLLPALDEDEPVGVAAGLAVGVGFLLFVRHWLGTHELTPLHLRTAGARRSLLVFLVLFVHSLPEGFAIGTA